MPKKQKTEGTAQFRDLGRRQGAGIPVRPHTFSVHAAGPNVFYRFSGLAFWGILRSSGISVRGSLTAMQNMRFICPNASTYPRHSEFHVFVLGSSAPPPPPVHRTQHSAHNAPSHAATYTHTDTHTHTPHHTHTHTHTLEHPGIPGRLFS